MSPSGTPHEQGIAADILVVGAGGSGLRAAIEAKERGAQHPDRRQHYVTRLLVRDGAVFDPYGFDVEG